jgi:hypothetical protein
VPPIARCARADDRVVVDSVDLPRAASVTRLVDAVVESLARRGRPEVGFDAVVASTVPIGSGLSSSAAFEVAIARAAAHVADFALDAAETARAAQEAEHLASGVPCGVMDQMASVFGRADHALLLDCRTTTVSPVALPVSVSSSSSTAAACPLPVPTPTPARHGEAAARRWVFWHCATPRWRRWRRRSPRRPENARPAVRRRTPAISVPVAG